MVSRRRRAWRAAAGRALRLLPRARPYLRLCLCLRPHPFRRRGSATACARRTRATAAIRAASCGRMWAGRGRTRVYRRQDGRTHYPRPADVVVRARARDQADRAADASVEIEVDVRARSANAGHGPVERRDGLSERGVAHAVAAVGKREGLTAQETRAGSCCMG
ncbi:hypothetical protein DFH11DRAFT_1653592 [Phellopilus nigrolimitatus]|nr:hypothetical protein DFH11DRAFT_1653592 [Phellopilus nigrolimitatus]